MFVDPQVVLEANSLHIRGKFLMKDSHKVCKTTQNFVKKKLKAFPSRLDSFYTNKTGATTMDMIDISCHHRFGYASVIRLVVEMDRRFEEVPTLLVP